MTAADLEKLGVDLFQQGHYEEAIAVFKQAEALALSREDAWMIRGRSFHAMNAYDDAIQCFDRVIELNRQNGWAWYGKSLSLCKSKRPERWHGVLSCLKVARELGNPRAKQMLLYLLELAEDPDQSAQVSDAKNKRDDRGQ